MRTGRFSAVALIIPDLHNPYYTAFASSFNHTIRQHDYDLIIEHTDSDLNVEARVLKSLLNGQIDGIAYFVSNLESHLEYLKIAATAGKSIVALTGPPPPGETLPFDAVTIDFTTGLKEAIEHLTSKGHQRFAFLGALAKGQLPDDPHKVFESFLAGFGIPTDQIDFIPCQHDLASIREAFHTFLREKDGPRPTALIALNDLSAIAAIRAATDFGLKVPRDLSVIGVDHIPFGEYLEKRLTTIEQPVEAMAKSAAHMLLNRLNSSNQKKNRASVDRLFLKASRQRNDCGSKRLLTFRTYVRLTERLANSLRLMLYRSLNSLLNRARFLKPAA